MNDDRTTTPAASLERFTWRDYASAAVLALAIAIGASLRMVPGVVGVVDDDAVYAVTAKALAEGDGYRLVNLPGKPPQTKYPVLYPAVLSLAWRAGSSLDTRIFAMQCTTTAIAAIALAMAYLYCVRFRVAARGPAFAGALLVASAPNVLFYCSQTLSEMPFLGLLVAALWVGESRLRSPKSTAAGDLFAGMVLALPLLCRTAGVVVPLAAIAVLAHERKAVRWYLLGALAVGLPWFLWVFHGVAATSDSVVGYQTDYFGWWRTHGSLFVPARNALDACASFTHIGLEGLAKATYAHAAGAKWIVSAIGVLPWLLVLSRGRSLSLLPVTLLAYLALLCAWPWPPDRFLVPILPFLAAMLFEAMRSGAAALGAGRAGSVVLCAAFAGVLLSNAQVLARYVSESRASGYPYFMLTDAPVEWRTYEQAFAWLREHSGREDVIAAGFDTMTSLYTGRPTVRPFVLNPLAMYYGSPGSPVSDVAEFEDILAKYGARYLLLAPLPAYVVEEAFYQLVYAASDEKPGLLRPMWQSKEDRRFVIFEVSARPGGS